MSYQHTQKGTLIRVTMGIIAVFMLVVMATTGEIAVLAVAFPVCLLLLIMFGSLTVAVDSKTVQIHFGVGWIHRNIQLSKIQSAEVIKTRWYYGWGIRLTPRGWLWNASGFDAVELTYQNGKHFIIGTDDPVRLAAKIQDAVGE